MNTKTEPGKGLRCVSMFAGIGGIDLACVQAGFEIVFAGDIDPYPLKIYNANFPHPAEAGDIRELDAKRLPEFELLAGGFPCQAFSIAGYREGFGDRKGRGTLFFELARLLEECRPEAFLFENVKNLKSHDGGNTFRVISQTLERLGYSADARVLNACEYGNVPQNRERIYIIGFRDPEAAARFSWPEPEERSADIAGIIGFGADVPERYYYTPEKCPFYSELEKGVKDSEHIYQWRRQYVRENKSGVVPALTANMGGGGHNVPLIRDLKGRIRKLTPAECLAVQGFPPDFIIPDDVSDTRAYKAAGNSVAVPVVRRLAEAVALALAGKTAGLDGPAQ